MVVIARIVAGAVIVLVLAGFTAMFVTGLDRGETGRAVAGAVLLAVTVSALVSGFLPERRGRGGRWSVAVGGDAEDADDGADDGGDGDGGDA
ncbi:hypothetical protein [Actinophytocola oryzae]|uniref:Uncharacterized protein n=1 Tax=Actinophytocola oryzae TaxID=502181 RepID=A0A4R7W3C0_9PSEU|nr:hypothetical protein [Actinophytocola oryzae]TDV56409.1 hypothetical protein CLV71_102476 [Actinophytocola oryzae]